MAIPVSCFIDVADGLKEDQFGIGGRSSIAPRILTECRVDKVSTFGKP